MNAADMAIRMMSMSMSITNY